MKIGIGMVAGDMMHTWTAYDLIHLVSFTSEALGHEVILNRGEGTILHAARQTQAERLLEKGCDWMFFVDSDMRVPVNAIQGMLQHDVPIVAANCSKRKRPVGPTARKKNAYLHMSDDATVPLWPDPEVHGLEQVETVGFGVIGIKADVFHQLPRPWFQQFWVPEVQKFVGEDVYFCGLCQEAEIPIYVDHDLSWVIRHTGQHEYSMWDVLAERDNDLTKPEIVVPEFAGAVDG